MSALSPARCARILDQITVEEPEEVRVRKKLLAYADDPERFCLEVLGAKMLTAEQRQFLRDLVEHGFRGRWLLRGGHGSGKTGIQAMAICFVWGVLALQDDADGRPLGCLVLLSAPKASSVKGTIYGQIRRFAAAAAERGYPLPGFLPRRADSYRGASAVSVTWHTADRHWDMEILTAARKARSDVSHGMSGRHHTGLQVLGVDEAAGTPEESHQAMDGLTIAANTLTIAALNPTSEWTAISQRILADPQKWRQIGFAVYGHINITLRRDEIPGGPSHFKLEEELRSSSFEDRGPVDDATLETERGDFVYGLPDLGTPEKTGPRDDGVPGHPGATPHVFRPANARIAGQWGPDWLKEDGEMALYPVGMIRQQTSAGTYRRPEGPPVQVGLDCHPMRTPTACPRWGPSAREALDANAKDGAVTIGTPHEIAVGALSGPEKDRATAQALLNLYGKAATYVIDEAAGGGVAVVLEDHGAKIKLVGFGRPPISPPTKLYGPVVSRRVEMQVHAAAAFRGGLIAAPYLPDLLTEMSSVGPLIPSKGIRQGLTLRDKTEMAGTMDALDTVVLCLDGVSVAPWISFA